MLRNVRIPKLSFSITPNEQGYLIACNEIPYLFTDSQKIEEINEQITKLVGEYIEYFPYDAKRRGIELTIPTEVTWKATPNSVAIE
jgi:predicted RNase H-like HicB family nuclease